jgi:hypothetical protein
MSPCIVIDFFSNNQQEALIIQIYSVIKLHMFRASSGVFYCTFGTGIMQVFVDRFQAKGHQNLHEAYQCQMYSRKLLTMGREDARNM